MVTLTAPAPARIWAAEPGESPAALAVWALEQEARLTPKPGLVDGRGSGAHRDMGLALLLVSVKAIAPWLARVEHLACEHGGAPPAAQLRACGVAAERDMLAATGGVNTHRGAIFALGLLVAAAADGVMDAEAVCERSATLASGLGAGRHSERLSGAAARARYGAAGAPGQALAGFPAVREHALPMLERGRAEGASEKSVRLDALLALIATVDDTCLLHRGGLRALHDARRAAVAVLDAGGSGTSEGARRLTRMDRWMRRERLSPGGSGDLLAATLLLDAVERLACGG
jgi:triphosphoribosyl-dephospho-CoA synthase